jgi:3,4-dihydroxy-2-butanone 4-phosphate synthase
MMRHYGLGEGVVLCAMLREDGTMAREHEVQAWAAEQNIPIVQIGDWVAAHVGA